MNIHLKTLGFFGNYLYAKKAISLSLITISPLTFAEDLGDVTIEGIKANAKLFPHPEDGTKSTFMTCPAGWTCQITAGHLFDALGLADPGFEQIDPGLGVALSSSFCISHYFFRHFNNLCLSQDGNNTEFPAAYTFRKHRVKTDATLFACSLKNISKQNQ